MLLQGVQLAFLWREGVWGQLCLCESVWPLPVLQDSLRGTDPALVTVHHRGWFDVYWRMHRVLGQC